MAREDLLARTFLELADASVDDADAIQVSQMIVDRCVELFDASAAGILLSDSNGHLSASASSSAPMQKAELFELHAGEGPCLDCYRTGQPVADPDLGLRRRWRRFAPVGLDAGFPSVHALPIRARGQVIGALNLFRAEVGNLDAADVLAAQALAQATAIAILRQRAPGRPLPVVDQLVPSLADRIIVEQAKGTLAERAGVSVDEAFRRIRRYARHHDLPVTDVCREVVDGTLGLVTFTETSLQRRWRNRA